MPMTAKATQGKAVIAGAGVAGLSAAISLRLHGWEVSVVEQAPSLAEVGAGLQISPNGSKLLDAWGVLPLLEGSVVAHDALELRRGADAELMFHLPMGPAARQRWGGAMFQVHRADLQQALLARLEELSPGALHLGYPVQGYRTCENGAALVAGNHEFEGDLVVGADGMHSALRAQMFPGIIPAYSGMMAWRTVVARAKIFNPLPKSVCVWTGPGRHAVSTHLRGGSLVNFVGVVEREGPEGGSWGRGGERAEVIADFASFAPPIQDILQAAPAIMRWGLYDCAPFPRWHDGRVIVIGDAAHPMLPSMAQGAVQAMEDAWVLAAQLKHADILSQGLAWTYAARIRRVSRIQRLSRKNALLFHRRSRLSQALTYGPAKWAGKFTPGLLMRRFDWIYRHEFEHG